MSKLHEQSWYKETCSRLARYPVQLSRMKYLEFKLQRECMPSVKMVAHYGEKQPAGEHDTTNEERELNTLQIAVRGIQLALEALTEREREIIRLKYFEKMFDVDIYTELGISNKTYYYYKDMAVEKIAECLGIKKMA